MEELYTIAFPPPYLRTLLRTRGNKYGFRVRASVECSTRNRGFGLLERQDFTTFIPFGFKSV